MKRLALCFLLLCLFAVALVTVPWLPGPLLEDMRANDEIKPLNARDPSALVIAPYFMTPRQGKAR